jgi:hypothetical protein
LRKEEEERRKIEKLKITTYFVKKETSVSKANGQGDDSNSNNNIKNLRFMPFQPKPNMTIAPVCRRPDLVHMDETERDEWLKRIGQELFGSGSLNKENGEGEDEDYESNYLAFIRKHPDLIRRQFTTCRKR